jgi:ribosomal protein S11
MATAVGLNMKITADTAGIGRGVNKTEQMLGKLSKSASSAAGSLRTLVGIEIGTRLASAFSSAASAAVDYAQRVTQSVAAMDDLAQRTGASTDALQGFQVAADLAGVQNLEGALQKVTVVLGDAANGSESAQKAFAKIGLSVEDLMSLSPEDQFRAVAEAISAIPDSASQAAAAVDLFGKSGVELLPLFASNLEEIETRAKQLGIVLSGDQVGAITEMDDALLMVRKTFDGIIGQVTANLAPVVTALSEEFLTFVESFNGFGGGGSGIADALTSGLLDFAEYMAGIFDAAIAQFGEFGATLQTAASVFEFVGNVFVAVGESLRVVFNIFELAGNAIAQALGAFIEKIGAWVSSDLEEFGRQFKENAIEAGKQNSRDLESAASGVSRAASAAVFGGSGLPQSSSGPASRAVQSARERFAGRNSPENEARREQEKAAAAAARQQANAARAAEKAAAEAKKAEEERLKLIQRADEAIAKAEEDRAKRSAEIEGERLDALSRRSNQALQVGDVRSGGISEILRIASGREDPAIEEYRKQVAELRKIDAKLGELRADKVKIIGGAGRAA